MSDSRPRRNFLGGLAAFGAASALSAEDASAAPQSPRPPDLALPEYALAQNYRSLKQSSYDRTGGNADRWLIAPGDTQEVFAAEGPGVITHIWFTIAAGSGAHLKEIVLRMYWDGNAKPSVETPVGDFFGLNLGQYFIYQSAFLNCSSIKALNCYFAMPFRRSARITVTNEGAQRVGAFYSNIDYQSGPGAARARALFPRAVPPGRAQHRGAISRRRAEEQSRRPEKLRLRGNARARAT